MSTPLKAFKAARFFDPYYLNKVKPLNTLLGLKIVNDSVLAGLKEEFPLYI